MQPRKDKKHFKRELINAHVPYELIALATLRYYATLQEAGKLDVVENMMRIEGITEEKAIQKCLDILRAVSEKQARFSQQYIDLTSPDSWGDLFNPFQQN